MKSAIQSFLQLAKRVERSAVSWAHAVTAMRGVGFFVVTAYALRKLPPSDMGLWYLMLSATGLAQNVELGFGNTIGRFCSYFNTGADRVPKLGLPEPPKSSQPSFAHLAGAAASARRLYPPLGLATMLAIVGIMGIWYMGGRINTALDIHHLVAFAILAVGSGINMSYHYWLGMLYGINRVRLYNQLLVIGFVINYSVAFLGIYAGMGLLALAVGQVLFNAVPRLAARYHMRRYIPRESFAAPARIPVSDLWPVTWRAGVTNLASGIYIQGMTVFCAIVTDLETTASFGLCLQLALTLHIFSSNWLSVKCPEINVLRASGRIGTASRLIVRRMAISLATYILGAAILVPVLPWVLHMLGSKTAALPVWQLAALFGLIGLDLVIGLHAFVIQTGNEAPHLKVFLTTAILSSIMIVPLGRRLGVPGIVAAPFLAQVFLGYWWTPLNTWKRLLNPPELTREHA